MQIGVVYPQTEIGSDLGAIKEYAQAAEEMGYSHILAFDHVLGANTASRPGWRGTYDVDSSFHEPLVLFGYLAGITSRIGFATGVIILPQRQAVLVAKQAAVVDVLSGGRLRLGVGIGWNDVEYEALGMNFRDRGARSEEQIEVMRALWKARSITVEGKWHTITDAGINPLSVQRPIPIWLGGGAEPVIRRIARLADGWMPQFQPDGHGHEMLERMRGYAREYGRDPAKIGLDGRMRVPLDDAGTWADTVARWRNIGATHVSVNTMGEGLSGATDHIKRLEHFMEAVKTA
ncbi:MAG: LLM class F420-dependent oxidoreductase [Dehalococcoidia bacterium]